MSRTGTQISGVSFATYSADDIRRLSVKRIVNPTTFDGVHPTAGGLYDPALGPIDQQDRCTTCALLGAHCPGHVGHIELPLPVFHPLFFMKMFNLLRITCRYCHHLTVARPQVCLAVAQLRLLDFEQVMACRQIETIFEDAEPSSEDEPKKVIKAQEWEMIINERYRALLQKEGIDPDSTPDYRRHTRNTEHIRREVVHNFLRACGKLSKSGACPNCGGIRRRISQVNHVRIVVSHLNKKDKDVMAAKNMREYSLFDDDKAVRDRQSDTDTSSSDEDSDGSDSESGFENEKEKSSGADGNSSAKKSKKETTTERKKAAEEESASRPFITPLEAHEHLRRLWKNENDIMSLLFRELVLPNDQRQSIHMRSTPDVFFIYVLPVPPSRFRPASKMGDKTFENPLTTQLQKVLADCKDLYDINATLKDSSVGSAESARAAKRHSESMQLLQQHVNVLMDSSLDTSANNKDVARGVRQTLERKEGLFRMHMMGKRVNYAARSVISPDPMIDTHEIGVPEVFALRLSYPEPVTSWNVQYLRSLVLNGPQQHPGATHIEDELGHLKELSLDRSEREAIADQLLTPQAGDSVRCKKVLRHIRTGDWVLVNRQPTLHKSSIMAHQVRVLKGERTLRLHYANCKTYNADFDGDEMNMHFPQNELARAEAATIACTHNQYCALDGSPLRGLIQDHIVAGFKLTTRDTLLDRETYQQIVYACLRDTFDSKPIKTLPPCIIKPREMWSGKQVVSTVLHHITQGNRGLNLKSTAKVNNQWSAGYQDLEGESTVIFRNGELICGVLDKNQCGATAYGLVHACHELYGGQVASDVLSTLGRLFTVYMKYNALSMAVDDLLLTPTADASRRKLIEQAASAGPKAACEFLQLDTGDMAGAVLHNLLRRSLETTVREPSRAAALDGTMMGVAEKLQSQIINSTVPQGLHKQFPRNVLQLIIQSGAKGSNVNATQISALLGQQALEGRRVPVMISGKTLPSFPAFDPSLRAGGMIFDRFLTGLRPQEFYFHCMAGREGLVDTAVKTSRSGYLQRCLVKHLEDLHIHYDLTVRDADGSVMQFLYGEDGLDVTKTKQLQNFAFMGSNYLGMLDILCGRDADYAFRGKHFSNKARKHMLKALADPKDFEPALSKFRPDRYFGSMSETLAQKLLDYIKADKDHLLAGENPVVTQDKLEQLVCLRVVRSLADPGENVGVLAAQALGEPSTQMTLNTFHFAGRSDMNVTLGIPRLREILMTASQHIKTPMMKAPLVQSPEALAEANRLCAKLQRVTLADVLSDVEVTHQLTVAGHDRFRLYQLRLNFIDPDEYKERFSLSKEALFQFVEGPMISKLVNAVLKAAKGASTRNIDNALDVDTAPTSRKGGRGGESEQSEGDGDGDGDEEGREKEPEVDEESESDNELGDGENAEDAGTLHSSAVSRHSESGAYDEDDVDSDDEEGGDSDDGEDGDSATSRAERAAKASRQARIEAVKRVNTTVYDYDFDDKGKWCVLTLRFGADMGRLLMVSLIESIAPKIVVRATQGIKRCILTKSVPKSESPPDVLQVEGINLLEMGKYIEIIKIDELRTNDIWAVLDMYGVEAARATMIREITEVFSAYGITVDHRHLSLITDFMTFEGSIRAMNRIGMRSSVNPFHKMSFETSTEFLRQATLEGDHDPCTSNSSRLVVGKVTLGGTGGHVMLQPLL